VDATIRVIDFDKVEQRNVASQFHGKPGVGKSKVQALKQAMMFMFAKDLETIPHRLGAENAKELLGKGHLVIDCLDNGASRRVLQDFVRAANIPCLHGALAADGGFGRVVWDEAFVIDDESAAGAATCDDGAHLPFIAITSAYLAKAAQEFLTKEKKIGFEINPAGATRT
jgi:molybdopterin/thiamine biosynthesis adenylyltransferase